MTFCQIADAANGDETAEALVHVSFDDDTGNWEGKEDVTLTHTFGRLEGGCL